MKLYEVKFGRRLTDMSLNFEEHRQFNFTNLFIKYPIGEMDNIYYAPIFIRDKDYKLHAVELSMHCDNYMEYLVCFVYETNRWRITNLNIDFESEFIYNKLNGNEDIITINITEDGILYAESMGIDEVEVHRNMDLFNNALIEIFKTKNPDKFMIEYDHSLPIGKTFDDMIKSK